MDLRYFHLLNYSRKAVEFVVLSDGFPLFSDLEGKYSRTSTDKIRALISGRAIPRPPF
jgi:hypothetical protein